MQSAAFGNETCIGERQGGQGLAVEPQDSKIGIRVDRRLRNLADGAL